MRGPVRWALASLAVLDLVAGTILVVWPGVHEELLHPDAMARTFHALQRTGAAWLARGGLALFAAARRDARLTSGVALMWAAEAPGALLLAWRTADTGPHTGVAYAAQAALALIVAVGLWRAGGSGKETS